MLGDQIADRPGRVRIDDHVFMIADPVVITEFHAATGATVETQSGDRLIEHDRAAEFLEDACQFLHQPPATAARVPDSEAVFDEVQDGEETGGVPWGHAQVLALEADRDLVHRMLEVLSRRRLHGVQGIKPQATRNKFRLEHVLRIIKGVPQDRLEGLDFGVVDVVELAERLAVPGTDFVELGLHAIQVPGGVDLETTAFVPDVQPIHRLEFV